MESSRDGARDSGARGQDVLHELRDHCIPQDLYQRIHGARIAALAVLLVAWALLFCVAPVFEIQGMPCLPSSKHDPS